jgi:hypothetical protein
MHEHANAPHPLALLRPCRKLFVTSPMPDLEIPV